MTTLPFDFDIFFRSGSSTQPEIAALCHGSESCSRCARTTDEKSHVLMMSCACGRISIGNVRANRSASSGQPQTICGDRDDVAQVSITSGSPMKPPGTPRWSVLYPLGTSLEGSIGRSATSAKSTSS